MKKTFNISLALLIFAGTGFLVMYLMKTKAASPPPVISERIWQVDSLSVNSGTYSPSITLYGKVESPHLYHASAPLLSRVENIFIREGEVFQKGQLLAQLDERDFLPQVQIAEAKLAEIQAKISTEKLKYQSDKQALKHEQNLLQLGRQALERALKIQKQKLASQSEADDAQKLVEQQRLSLNTRKLNLDGHRARMEQLKATQKQLQAELEKARLAMERARFYAPYNGVVAKVNVATGDQLATGGQLFSIYPDKGLEIRAKIPASIKDEIAQDVALHKKLQAHIFVDSRKIPLNLERLAGQATSSGIDALFAVEEGHAPLRLGAIYELNLIRGPQDNLFVVPYKAIYGVDKIYKVELDSKQDTRMLAIAMTKVGNYIPADKDMTHQSFLLIKSEQLRDGDKLITTHLPNALNGLKIKLTQKSNQISGQIPDQKPGQKTDQAPSEPQ